MVSPFIRRAGRVVTFVGMAFALVIVLIVALGGVQSAGASHATGPRGASVRPESGPPDATPTPSSQISFSVSLTPSGWLTGASVVETIAVSSVQPLNITTARYRVTKVDDLSSAPLTNVNLLPLSLSGNAALLTVTDIPLEESATANQIQFVISDTNGFSQTSREYTLPTDLTKPTSLITAPQSVITTAGTYTLWGSAADATSLVSTVVVLMVGNDIPLTGTLLGDPQAVTRTWYVTWNVPVDDNSQHELVSVATDKAGNVQTAGAPTKVPVDTTALTIKIVTPTAGTTYNLAGPSIALISGTASANSGIAYVRVYTNGLAAWMTAALTATGDISTWSALWTLPLVESTFIVTATARDNSGHTVTGTAVITVDRIAPVSRLESSSALTLESPASIALTWVPTDGLGVASTDIEYYTTASTDWRWLTTTHDLNLTYNFSTANTYYYFRSQARDLAGNVEPVTKTAEVTVFVKPYLTFLPAVLRDFSAACLPDPSEPKNDSPLTTEIALTNITVMTSTICRPSDEDYYRVVVTTPRVIALELTGLTTTANYKLELLDGSSNAITSSTRPLSSSEHIAYEAVAGTYYVHVHPETVASGANPYTLTAWFNGADPYEPNDTWQTAHGPLLSGSEYKAYLPSSADNYDYYFFDVSTPFAATIDLTGIPPGTDYDLYLYDVVNGNTLRPLGSSAGSGPSEKITYNGNGASGRYYVLVYRYAGSNPSQPYTLKVTWGP
ncbi:MAG: PPC domain-containing protein [Chloroflexi bacterium]|nr:PPC domain-containing protein [Chloroflexota bacterium]